MDEMYKVICTVCHKYLGDTDEEPSNPKCKSCYENQQVLARRGAFKVIDGGKK